MTSDSKAVCGGGEIPNTDDADWTTVLAVVRLCARSWVPEARLVGNVRAGDIARACDAALASTAGAGAGDWQPTDKVMEISRAKLYDIKRAWADHTALDEGNISFLLRMAGCYLREAPAVPALPRSGPETASPPAPAEHGVEIRELHAALSKGHALLCESGPDRCWVKIGFGWLQDAQDAHGTLARFIKDGVPAALPPLTAAFSFPQPQRSRMYDVLRQLGQAAIRSQKITDHDAASAAQRECLSVIEALVSEALSQGGGAGRSEKGEGETLERVRHVKRGTEYEVLGEAEAQVSYDRIGAAHRVGRPLWDENRLTVYRCLKTGKLWCRFTDEFRDGRFVPVEPAEMPAALATREAARG